ncbi:MAG: PASTA domain-containing protein, partial [Spirochaetota bacterium]
GDGRVVHAGRITVQQVVLPSIDDTVPDFSGLPKRTLLPLLERDDVRVVIDGYGWVARQSPPPGTPFERGMTLRLELE